MYFGGNDMEKRYSDGEVLKLKKIAKTIIICKKHNMPLNRYDYYMKGGVSFKNGEKILYNLYKEGRITQIEYAILVKYIEKERYFGASRNKDFVLATHYQFGNIVITAEEKKQIWNSLNEFGLEDGDIDDLVFAGAIRAYAIENGLIPSKKLVRKK